MKPFRTMTQRWRKPLTRRARQTAADRVLAERLCATFEQELAMMDVQGIHFYVKDGTVTLYGSVAHALNRELLVALVKDLPDVRGVVSHLHVDDQPAPEAEAPAEAPA